MKKIYWDNVLCLIICIPSLRSLTVYLRRTKDCAYKFHIYTPALQYLNVEGDLICEYLASENLSSLLEAKVNIYTNEALKIDDNSYSNKIFIFFKGLSKVKFLSISVGTLKVTCSSLVSLTTIQFILEKKCMYSFDTHVLFGQAIRFASSYISPHFRNLTRLELANVFCCDLCVVVIKRLLESMDNLEHLLMVGSYCLGPHEAR